MKKRLEQYAKKLKISDIGVCKARIYDELGEILRRYDTPFSASFKKRISPFEFVEDARSIIMCVFNYYSGECDENNLSRYVWGLDYHDVIKNKLSRLCDLLEKDCGVFNHYIFCDNSPLCDKYLAYLSGLGIIGDNHLLIHPKYGSYVFIGGIVTNLDISANKALEGGCGSCGKCKSACPGKVFDDGFDARKCASYIMQQKGELSCEQQQIMRRSGKTWGCDVCSEVCEHNSHALITDIEEFLPKTYNIDGSNVDCDDAFHEFSDGRAFSWRGRAVLKRNFDIWNKYREQK